MGNAIFCESLVAACAAKTYTKADGRQACGFFLGRGLSWTEANAKCLQLGARLPVITTAQENQDVLDVQVYYFHLVVHKHFGLNLEILNG